MAPAHRLKQYWEDRALAAALEKSDSLEPLVDSSVVDGVVTGELLRPLVMPVAEPLFTKKELDFHANQQWWVGYYKGRQDAYATAFCQGVALATALAVLIALWRVW